MRIKAIVFDWGGVIELYEGGSLWEHISPLIDVPVADLRDEYFRHNHLYNIGNWRRNDLILKVVSVFDQSEETKEKVVALLDELRSKRKVNTELLDMFPMFKKQGLKVAIFSNNNSELRKKLEDNGIVKLVDELVVSVEIGHQKPHKEAFQALFERLKLSAEEVIFVDDTPKSLEKADEIGYIPILFKNNEQLKMELGKTGISVI